MAMFRGSILKTLRRASTACLCAAILAAAMSGRPAAAGDPQGGAAVFKACLVCHTNEAGKNKIGPTLFGVVGRHSASIADYNYSPAMKQADKVWTEAELDKYLANPKAMVPGTKMTFPGLAEQRQRDDLIAYLKTLR